MSAKKTSVGEAVEPSYALVDTAWRKSVDDKFREGAELFRQLMHKQDSLLRMLEENTSATTCIEQKIESHVNQYIEFTRTMRPAVEAINTMQAGVRALGTIGRFFAWCGKWIRRTVIWLTPMIAAAAAVWHYFFGGPKP